MCARGRASVPLLVALFLSGCAAPIRTAVPLRTDIPSPPPAGAPLLPPPASPPAIAAPQPLDEAALRAAYGRPDFVRKEEQSELWRYDGAGCALFLFLYRENGALRLRYMESLPRGTSEAADPQCVVSVKARAAPA